jgi:arylsulfatase A-like enzyme
MLLLSGLASGLPVGGSTTTKPNILLISSDQQRTSTLACYGHKFAHSPNLDKLAADGVRFTDAYTASPVCSPSRTSVLTGVHVPVHGVYENDVHGQYRTGLTPFFDLLKSAGYSTALFGKTHFDPVPSTIDHLDAHSGNSDMRGYFISADNWLETYLVNQTMAWLDNKTHSEQPWFAYLSMVSPHPPDWVPDGPWKHVYDNVTLPALDYQPGDIGELPTQTRMLLGLLGKEEGYAPAFPDGVANMSYVLRQQRNYYALAAYVDHQVGRMLRYLERRELVERTLVAFWSDHGSQLFDHGIKNDKHNFYDASLRVPLILRWPGVLPKAATRAFATTLDITATVATAAGVDLPRDWQGFGTLPRRHALL